MNHGFGEENTSISTRLVIDLMSTSVIVDVCNYNIVLLYSSRVRALAFCMAVKNANLTNILT